MSLLGRRDWLVSLFGAPFAARWLAACERGGAPPTDVDGALLGPALERGHALRDGDVPRDAFLGAPTRRVTVAVVGGGASGLAAAWRLRRRGLDDVEVLELEDAPGGTARAGQNDATRFPWGAHYLPLPFGDQPALFELLAELGATDGTDDLGDPVGAEERLVRDPAERVFHAGFWEPGLWPAAGADARDRAELARFRRLVDGWVARRDGDGRRPFALPVRSASGDPDVLALDRMTATEWLDREGFRSGRVRWLVDYGCRDDYGVDANHASAWAALFYHAARVRRPGEEARPLLAWPEGNAALVGHMARAIGGARLRTGRLVAGVVPGDDAVRLEVLHGDRPEVVLADHVVLALPRFVARRVVRGVDLAPWDPPYGAWLVANLHLRRRPRSRGFPLAWDNVLLDSPSLGYVVATHQSLRDHGPTVWTWYLPLVDADPKAGRRKLLDAPWEDWRDLVVADLARAHVDLPACLERIDVWRWGHGMVQARPGVVSDPARRRAAAHRGRLHFAGTDLSGVALFEEAFDHGVRAADEILAARAPGAVATEVPA